MIRQYLNETSAVTQAVTLLSALLLISLGVAIGAKAAFAASLKPVSTVSDDVLRLGDIFDGVQHNADYVLGAAPQPGKDMVLNARTLYRIANAMDVNWRPATTGDTITIRREANLVSYETIENEIKKELKNNGLNNNINIELRTAEPSIILPKDTPLSVEISDFNFDTQKDFFTATLVAPSKDNPIRKVNISGVVDRLVEMPVLRTTLQNGDVIGKNDIQLVNISSDNVQHNAIMKAEDMIGMTPRRIAHAGKFIQRGTLEKPQLVERGDEIIIHFSKGPLMLTAKGKALQSGAIGDTIRVTNVTSAKTISATINGSKEVIVQ